jgi:hypothetical protein
MGVGVRAAEALRYLGCKAPACLGNLRVLDKHETAANEAAAMRGDRRRFSRPCNFVGARREVNICQHGHPGPAPPRAIRVQGGRGQAVDGREAQAP